MHKEVSNVAFHNCEHLQMQTPTPPVNQVPYKDQ